MSDRRRDGGGAVSRAGPWGALHWVLLLVALVWTVPVCGGHAVGEVLSAPGPALSVSAPGGETPGRVVSAHLCPGPGTGHQPGDAHCRPVAGPVAVTGGPVSSPAPPPEDGTAGAWTVEVWPVREAPAAPPGRAPDLHRLQVQRV
ncbi:hypothetical protein [Streptomyces zingiberis]|uniref:Secreted protein n=1 Tax=Streptomyces zingiberis TaxID=2053010 RepID=A0ABX1C2V2_9ACTN|nr:hypothetical protein [Streptomyces zingiberis]NJQ01234.1 hypothetical protein [Streptomyces zingiberis]